MFARHWLIAMRIGAVAGVAALVGCSSGGGGGGGGGSSTISTTTSRTSASTGEIITITVVVNLNDVFFVRIDFVKQAGATGAISSVLIESPTSPGGSTWVHEFVVPPCVAGSFRVEAFANTASGTFGPGTPAPFITLTDTSGGNCGGGGGDDGPPPPPF